MSVKNNTFSDLVRVEQVRRIESEKSNELTYAGVADMEGRALTGFKYDNFMQHLIARAEQLIRDNGLEESIVKPHIQFKRVFHISLIIAAVLGSLATGHAVSELQTLNIYWLLTALLGFNVLSLVLWVIGIAMNIQSLSSGIAAQLASWWSFRDKKKSTIASMAGHAWWENHLTGTIGKWRISVFNHQFWLIYLTAGTILLFLLMLAKQYNFVWGTTLLPEQSLPKLTATLGKPLTLVGLEIPDNQQISMSRIGADRQDAKTRSTWARFLIGVLLIYGVLPRLLLLAVSVIMLKWSERQFKPDLYLPYYIDLRQRLTARNTPSVIIDADPLVEEQSIEVSGAPINHTIPEHTYALGIELDNSVSWPDSVSCDLNIIDQQSRKEAIEWVKTLNGSLMIGVAAYRLPDRGIQRIVKDLLEVTRCKPWLILLNKNPAVSIPDDRELAWFRLAEACKIPAEQVISQ